MEELDPSWLDMSHQTENDEPEGVEHENRNANIPKFTVSRRLTISSLISPVSSARPRLRLDPLDRSNCGCRSKGPCDLSYGYLWFVSTVPK